MKSKDQQLLEEAYNDVVKKMMAGANNPGWSLERGLTSGQGFKGLPEPEGDWPDREGKKKSTPKQKPKAVKKAKEEDELDVEGDPVGSYRSIATPEPEPETKVVSVSFDFLDQVQTKDPELYQIITSLAKNVKQDGNNLKFTYSADHANNIEYFIQNYN